MNILFLGSGNVATHVALAIHKTEHRIVQVYSRKKASAAALGNRLGVPYTHLVEEIMQDADLYIYAVSDDALTSLVSLNIAPQAMHVHTAGSVAMDIFKGYKKHYGVLYPLQSLSKDKAIDFKRFLCCWKHRMR
ncbi:MAG TPA: NAD(P)-binding domain-containing protein [Paludibacter sp.]|nr:NAD(P)-binding domain-containing protein [Paludibacter sp.]